VVPVRTVLSRWFSRARCSFSRAIVPVNVATVVSISKTDLSHASIDVESISKSSIFVAIDAFTAAPPALFCGKQDAAAASISGTLGAPGAAKCRSLFEKKLSRGLIAVATGMKWFLVASWAAPCASGGWCRPSPKRDDILTSLDRCVLCGQGDTFLPRRGD